MISYTGVEKTPSPPRIGNLTHHPPFYLSRIECTLCLFSLNCMIKYKVKIRLSINIVEPLPRHHHNNIVVTAEATANEKVLVCFADHHQSGPPCYEQGSKVVLKLPDERISRGRACLRSLVVGGRKKNKKKFWEETVFSCLCGIKKCI